MRPLAPQGCPYLQLGVCSVGIVRGCSTAVYKACIGSTRRLSVVAGYASVTRCLLGEKVYAFYAYAPHTAPIE